MPTETVVVTFRIELSKEIDDDLRDEFTLQCEDALGDAVREFADEYYGNWSGYLKGKYGGEAYRHHKAIYEAIREIEVCDSTEKV